ncbi:Neutral zinc metallopeptidase, Zn-binding site [Phytophthora cinnamomi]|uniref:Neutral zinc metallopeptidase, Zn-binding site n=1 Tax=Phytophthora cinnamomi TaxID=4785 RepID=UPI003559BD80|nr:Neutral zinc metallopeptidase, Zn-binding site [Phytophthora cinnamomi]
MHSSNNSSSTSLTRRLLTAAAIVGLGASSLVSAAPAANATREANTFGVVTSGNNKCVVGNPNAYISQSDLDWVWEHRIGPNAKNRDAYWNLFNNKNYIMDHIVKNKGSLNYCVRWKSSTKLTKSVASKFEAMLNRQFEAWNQWLIGYDCWPYNDIKVKVAGFAVTDSSALDWNDDSLGKIYKGDLDDSGVPQCPKSCSRFYDVGLDTWSDTSSCQGQPWDMYLWPKEGLEGGAGEDVGQIVNQENVLSTLDDDLLHIVAHEIGHGFGLPDFYNDADMPGTDFPACIMRAGSSMSITPADGWMLRRVLEHTKSRYNF